VKRYAIVTRSKDLFHPNRIVHERVLPLFKTELDFYNTVGRIACAMAELNISTRAEADLRLNWTILLMVGYLTDRLSSSVTQEQHPLIPQATDHVVNTAIQLAALLPSGLWTDIQCKQLDTSTVVYECTRHEQDYR
jgi:hypothetical protein